MRIFLHLVSDLDGTWIPPEGDHGALRALERQVADIPDLRLTFATGRTLHSALAHLLRYVELWPDHFVTDVGTAIYHKNASGKWIEDPQYARMISRLWDAEAAEQLAKRLPPGIRRQPGLQPRRRMALEVQPGWDPHAMAEQLRGILTKAWFPADVLPSNGQCLDVLPKGVDKGTALEHLTRHCRLPSFLLVCGDSENDLGMLRKADMAVVMAGSILQDEELGLPRDRIIHPKNCGPAGIQEALIQLQAKALPEGGAGRPGATYQEVGNDWAGGAP